VPWLGTIPSLVSERHSETGLETKRQRRNQNQNQKRPLQVPPLPKIEPSDETPSRIWLFYEAAKQCPFCFKIAYLYEYLVQIGGYPEVA